MFKMLKRGGGVLLLAALFLPAGSAFAEEGEGFTEEVVPIDQILKKYKAANEGVKASSRKVEAVKAKQKDMLARIRAGEKVDAEKVWEVKEEFVEVLFEQYHSFNKLRSYEYKIIGALKRLEYKIQAQERYLGTVIVEIDDLIDRYKRSLEYLKDKIKVEENVEGPTGERVRSLKGQKRTLSYMLRAYQRFGEYASKVHVVQKKRQETFGKKLKIFGEKIGQLPYIVQNLKNALRITHQIYRTSQMFEELPEFDSEVKAFIKEAGEFGFGKDFEETLKVMSDMPEIFSATVPEGPETTPEEKKALEEEFKKIEKKYKK
ncbi:MAG: hypothetical protein ACYS47_00295 [Planctomycetota bacterium]|jgi:hypothetical protein